MAITQQFLSQCSDEQINKGVAWLEARKLSIYGRYSWTTKLMSSPPSYCTNPNDAWDILVENNITVFHEESDPRVVIRHPGNLFHSITCRASHKSELLRAAMEAYILMNNQEGV